MCSINHELKAIYMHIPKNGGLYIQKILETFYGFKTIFFTHEDHKNFIDLEILPKNYKIYPPNMGFLFIKKMGIIRYYMSSKRHSMAANMDEAKWKEYYKFTFVRNPYDKLVSAWKYCNTKIKIPRTFSGFIENIDTIDHYPAYSHAFITQTDHLIDMNEELNFNYIGRFENLNEELITILHQIGITTISHIRPIANNKKHNSADLHENYTIQYNEELLKFANEHFDCDFNNFEYLKCNNMEDLITNSTFIPLEDFILKNKMILNALGALGGRPMDAMGGQMP